MKIKRESYFTISLIVLSFAAGTYALTKWDFKTALVPGLCGGAIFILCFFPYATGLTSVLIDPRSLIMG